MFNIMASERIMVTNETFRNLSPMINFNKYMNLPPMISIIEIRCNSILEIYTHLLDYTNEELDRIITYFTFITIPKNNCYEKILSKATMLEEMIHKKTLVSVKKNVKSQAELNMFYHIYLYELIQNIKTKSILENTYTELENLRFTSIYNEYLKPLLEMKELIQKCNLESYYTKLSILEELMIYEANDSRTLCVDEEINMLKWLSSNIKDYNIKNEKIIFHNGNSNESDYKCIECTDECKKVPDLMFKSCGHMCLCVECAKKMEYKNICPICRIHSDTLIQVRNPF